MKKILLTLAAVLCCTIISGLSGEEARIEVGKLKIDDVEGDEISRCKVQSGAKEIKSLLEAGESLVVISID